MKTLYFAYGSNMSIDQLKEREITYKYLGVAILHDYQLRFNKISKKTAGTGYANIVPRVNCLVEGLLFEVDNLEKLDKKEGYPNHYTREELSVTLDGATVTAIAYVANPFMISENLMPEKEYLNRLLSAKGKLSEEYYGHLSKTETVD